MRAYRDGLGSESRAGEALVDVGLPEREAGANEPRRCDSLPARSISSPISPNAALTADAGNGKNAGRCSARPSALTNSWFVTTPGATTLTGPASGCSRAKRYAATVSSNDTQLHHWRPTADASTRAQLERRQQSGERAAVLRENDALAQVHRSEACSPGRLGGRLPRLDDLGEEARARHRVLVDDLVAAVAVKPCRGSTDEDGTARETGCGLGNQGRTV